MNATCLVVSHSIERTSTRRSAPIFHCVTFLVAPPSVKCVIGGVQISSPRDDNDVTKAHTCRLFMKLLKSGNIDTNVCQNIAAQDASYDIGIVEEFFNYLTTL